MTHTTGRATRAATVRALAHRAPLAAVALLALGGSIQAVYAEDSVTVPTQPTVTAQNSELPRFQPSETAAIVDIAEPAIASAADVAEVEPAPAPAGDAILEDIPDGIASWYGAELAGNRTANGERFDPSQLTAAHRTLPMGSKVRVTHAGKSVVVRINDRGPFHGNRVIDLSQAAAEQIGLRRKGSAPVELVRLES